MIPCVAVDDRWDAASSRIVLVGCGKMGGALLQGWLKAEAAGRIDVVEPAPLPESIGADVARAADTVKFGWVAGPEALPPGPPPDAVVLAVKPQAMATVAPAYRSLLGPDTVVLSVAAGRTLAALGRLLGPAAIVRAMPNTPAAIGRGVSVLVAGAGVTPAQRELCDRLMRAAGTVEWVAEEALIDAVTALSGSGPAYVFLLIEALAEAGAATGLPPDLAARLARATVTGAGALAEASAEDAATLRRNVTSPGGTTEAALRVLMAPDGIRPLFERALAAAAQRSRELAG